MADSTLQCRNQDLNAKEQGQDQDQSDKTKIRLQFAILQEQTGHNSTRCPIVMSPPFLNQWRI